MRTCGFFIRSKWTVCLEKLGQRVAEIRVLRRLFVSFFTVVMTMKKDGPEAQLALPPGFRFHPTDLELVEHYLTKKAANEPFTLSIIAEVDLYKFNPWELPEKSLIGEKEWYFFSPRDRKYPNGNRPNRSAGTGYWKATGTEKPICSETGLKIGVKKALVFYIGKAPRGNKTSWIMHEYRLVNGRIDASSSRTSKKRKAGGSLRLDDWVLCRIYKKATGAQKAAAAAAAAAAAGKPRGGSGSCVEELRPTLPESDPSKFNSTAQHIASLKSQIDQEKANWMEFGDSPMADKFSRCVGGQVRIDCTPMNIKNTNSIMARTLMEFEQKESQYSNGVRAEVGSSRYPFDRPPRPPISASINLDQLQCGGLQGPQQYTEPCAAPLFPEMVLPFQDSTEEEVQSSFRLYQHNEIFDQSSQRQAFNFESQAMHSTFSQLESVAAFLSSSFIPGTEYLPKLQ